MFTAINKMSTISKPKSATLKRSMSAVQRPRTSLVRAFTASSRPRRPYSAYTSRGTEEQGPKFDAPETNREWWRQYVKVLTIEGEKQTPRNDMFFPARKRQFPVHTPIKASWRSFVNNRSPMGFATRAEDRPVHDSTARERYCYQEPMTTQTSSRKRHIGRVRITSDRSTGTVAQR